MKVHLCVPTTVGVSLVMSIEKMFRGVPTVCVDGDLEPAGISLRYAQFAQPGVGVIADDFGHDRYRIDVTSDIDNGTSWQLAFYLAHWIDYQGLLGNGKPQPGDIVLWATGTIKRDRKVHAVEAIETKLRCSLPIIKDWLADGVKVYSFFPSSNADQLAAIDPAILNVSKSLMAMEPVESLRQAKQIIEPLLAAREPAIAPQERGAVGTETLEMPATNLPAPVARTGDAAQRWKYWAIVIASAALFALALVTLLEQYNADEHQRRAASIELDDFGTRVDRPASRQSAALQGRPQSPVTVRVASRSGRDRCAVGSRDRWLTPQLHQFEPLQLKFTCEIEWIVAESDTAAVALSLDNAALISLQRTRGGWMLPMPEVITQDRTYAVVILKSATKNNEARVLNRAIEGYDFQSGPVTEEWLRGTLRRLGLKGEVYTQKLLSQR